MKRACVVTGILAVASAIAAAWAVSPGASSRFLPSGRDKDMVRLVAPFSWNSVPIQPWRLAQIRSGPDCDVTFAFSMPGSDERPRIRIGAGNKPGDPIAVDLQVGPASQTAFGDASRSFLEIVRANDPGRILDDICLFREAGTNRDSAWLLFAAASILVLAGLSFILRGLQVTSLVASASLLLWSVLAVVVDRFLNPNAAADREFLAENSVLVLACGVAAVFAGLADAWRKPSAPGETGLQGIAASGLRFVRGAAVRLRGARAGSLWTGVRSRVVRIREAVPTLCPDDVPTRLVLWIAGAAVLVRLVAAAWEPLEIHEVQPFQDLWPPMGPPHFSVAMTAWWRLGGLLGLEPGTFWLRLVNVALGACLVWILVRLGRVLGAPWAGFWTAILFTFSPTALELGAVQEHYFAEMVATTWFVERALTYVVGRRPVFPSLAVSATVAIGMGHMPLLVVAPGLLAVGACALLRRELRGFLLATLAIELAYLPVLLRIGNQVATMAMQSVSIDLTPGGVEMMRAVVGMVQLSEPRPLAEFGLSTLRVFPGGIVAGPAGLILLALLGLNLVDRKGFWFILTGIAATFVIEARFSLLIRNTAQIWPLFAFLMLWSLERLGDRIRAVNVGMLLHAGFVCLLLWSGWTRSEAWQQRVFEREDASSLVRRIDAEDPETPLVVLGGNIPTLCSLCQRVGTFRELRGGCIQSSETMIDFGWEGTIRGRPVILWERDAPAFRDLLCSARWRDKRFWVLDHVAMSVPVRVPPQLPDHECRFVSFSSGYQLFLCTPRAEACAKAH